MQSSTRERGQTSASGVTFAGWTTLFFEFFINKKSLLKRISINFREHHIL